MGERGSSYWDRVLSLVDEVRELDAVERAARLARLAEREPDLHAEVVRQLTAEPIDPGFLDPPIRSEWDSGSEAKEGENASDPP